MELLSISSDPLIPNNDLIFLRIRSVEFAEKLEENNIGIPVKELSEIGFKVEGKSSELLFIVSIVVESIETANIPSDVVKSSLGSEISGKVVKSSH